VEISQEGQVDSVKVLRPI